MRDKLEEVHEKLRQDTSLTGAQKIDLIRQLAEGPRDAAKRHLEDIATGTDFYSPAEVAAALAALENLAVGRPNYDLMEKVEARNPGSKVPAGPASLAATIFFWERPGSQAQDTAPSRRS